MVSYLNFISPDMSIIFLSSMSFIIFSYFNLYYSDLLILYLYTRYKQLSPFDIIICTS